MPTTFDIQTIEQFLYEEASLLDNPDLKSWMDLFAEDGSYWMPANYDQQDPELMLSHIYEDRVLMEVRYRNFIHPRAASKECPIRSSHIISNVRLNDCNEETGECTVTSNFHALVYYLDKQTSFAGTYTHKLISMGESYRIKQKRVDLINCEAAHSSIVIYL